MHLITTGTLVETFFRQNTNIIGLLIKLRDLESEAKYKVNLYGNDKNFVMSGKVLMEDGLKAYSSAAPSAELYVIKSADNKK